MSIDFKPTTTVEHLVYLLAAHGVEHVFSDPGTVHRCKRQ